MHVGARVQLVAPARAARAAWSSAGRSWPNELHADLARRRAPCCRRRRATRDRRRPAPSRARARRRARGAPSTSRATSPRTACATALPSRIVLTSPVRVRRMARSHGNRDSGAPVRRTRRRVSCEHVASARRIDACASAFRARSSPRRIASRSPRAASRRWSRTATAVLVEHGAGRGQQHRRRALPRRRRDARRRREVWARRRAGPQGEGAARPPSSRTSVPGSSLFTYLHLAANEALTRALLERRVRAIGYETIQLDDGSLPLLAPMSEVAGPARRSRSARGACRRQNGGRGVLLSRRVGRAPRQGRDPRRRHRRRRAPARSRSARRARAASSTSTRRGSATCTTSSAAT